MEIRRRLNNESYADILETLSVRGFEFNGADSYQRYAQSPKLGPFVPGKFSLGMCTGGAMRSRVWNSALERTENAPLHNKQLIQDYKHMFNEMPGFPVMALANFIYDRQNPQANMYASEIGLSLPYFVQPIQHVTIFASRDRQDQVMQVNYALSAFSLLQDQNQPLPFYLDLVWEDSSDKIAEITEEIIPAHLAYREQLNTVQTIPSKGTIISMAETAEDKPVTKNKNLLAGAVRSLIKRLQSR